MTSAAKKLARDGRRRALVAALVEQGWTIGMTSKNHIRATSPSGGLVILSGTPSSRHALDQQVRDLRRYGFIWAA